MSMFAKQKTKRPLPSAKQPRTVIPTMLGSQQGSTTVDEDDEECRTCLGHGRIRDGATEELRRCLDCGGTGVAP